MVPVIWNTERGWETGPFFVSGNLGTMGITPTLFPAIKKSQPRKGFLMLPFWRLEGHLLRSHCLFAWHIKSPKDEPDKRGGAGAGRDTD